MAIKYRVSYKDTFNNQWRIDIDIKGYSGAIISDIRGSSSVCDITHEGDSNNPFEPFFSSNATISLYNSGNIDVSELQNLQDRDATVSVYKSGSLYWKGFAIPDGIEESIVGHNPEVIITATDGLEMLEGLEFNRGALPLTDNSPINYISLILGSTNNLGLWLPIKWVDSLRDKVNNQEVLQGAKWAVSEDGFIGEDGVRKNCDYILRGAVESIGGRIYQSGGEWKIDRLNDLTSGNLPFRRRATITSAIATGSENRDKVIGNGGYRLLTDSRPISTIHPALKRLKVTYTHDQFKNIIPNGSQDKWEFLNLDLLPQDWGIINKKSYQSVEIETTIDARSGNSARLKNDMAGSQATVETALRYSMAEGSTPAPISIPIDTSLMYNEMMFSFKFMIESAESDIIDGEEVVRKVTLTRNGFPYIKNIFPLRFLVSMKITKPSPTPQGDVFQYALNEFGNWVLFSQIDDTDVGVFLPIDADFNSSSVVKINDIVSTTGSRGFMKLPEALIDISPDVKCELRVDFFVYGKTTVRIDDISVEVNGNNEVYQTERSSTNFTDTEEYEMAISSSFNGFYISNYMSSWDKSDSEYYYKDGTDEGSLTYINARSKMRMRGVPNTILDVNIHGDGFSADSIISLPEFAGKKFMPLYSSIDTVSGDTKLVLYEIRNTFFGDIVTKMVPSGSLTSAGGNWTGGGGGGGGITPIETLESVTTRGNVTTKIIEAHGVRSGTLLEIPDNEPLLADRRAGKTYIYANGEGSGSAPSPVLGNLEDLQNVADIIANGKFLQKINGVWQGVDLAFPDLNGYATQTWVNTQLTGYVPTSRTLAASTGLEGGGDLTTDRTLKISDGVVPLTTPIITVETGFNEMINGGFYIMLAYSPDNPNNRNGFLDVKASSESTHVVQVFRSFTTNKTFTRAGSRDSDVWSDWTEVWTSGNLRSNADNDARYSLLSHTHTFASLTSKPTTIAGYGITDAYTKSQIDSGYVTIATKQEITGSKNFTKGLGIPDIAPVAGDIIAGVTYIYANGSGSGSAPAPTLSNLEDLQNVQSTIANGKYLQKIAGIWTGVDISFPSLAGYALESWVIAGFEPKFTKNTAFNKNFGTTAGTVAQGNDSRINNGQTAFGWGNHADGGYATETYVGDAIDNIEIGGRNLLLGTDKDVNLTDVGTRWNDYSPTLQRNSSYVFSFDVKGSVPTSARFTVSSFGFPVDAIASNGAMGSDAGGTLYFNIGVDLERFWIVIKTSNWSTREVSKPLNIFVEGAGIITISNFKLESGNKATAWTPAPEDQVTDWDESNEDSFSYLKNKPTTIAGYGITDAVTLNTKQTIAGVKDFDGGIGLPSSAPVAGQSTVGVTYIYANGSGSGSAPAPTLSNLEDLQNVQSTIANGKYLQKISGIWTGVDITFPSLSGYALQSWVTTNFEPKFTKNTGFNKNFGTTAGTVAQGNDSRINNGQTAFGWGDHSGKYLPLGYSDTSQSFSTNNNPDNATNSIFYASSQAINKPFNTNSSILSVEGLIGYGFQIGATSTNLLGLAYRKKHVSAWTEWREFWDSSNLRSNSQNDARYSQLGHTHTIAQVTGLQAALNGKENSFTKNTAFNKNFGTTAGTVAQGNQAQLLIDNIIIGGTNLIGGGFINGAWNQANIGFNDNGSFGRTIEVIELEVGKEYSFSMKSGAQVSTNGIWITFRNADNTYNTVIIRSVANFKFIAPSPLCTISYNASFATTYYGGDYFKNNRPKLELGNVYTDWSISPNDVVRKAGDDMTGKLTAPSLEAKFNNGTNFIKLATPFDGGLSILQQTGVTGLFASTNSATNDTIFQSKRNDTVKDAYNLLFQNRGGGFGIGVDTIPANMKFQIGRSSISPLQGTVTLTNGSSILTGIGTNFATVFRSGDKINIDGIDLYIVSISSNTSLTISNLPTLVPYIWSNATRSNVYYNGAGATLEGSVTLTNNSSTVTGLYTRFISEFKRGQRININGVWYYVSAVNNSTSLVISTNATTLAPTPYTGITKSNLQYYGDPINTFSVATNGDVIIGDKLTLPLAKVTRTLGIPTGVPPIGDREAGITYLYALT